jgi:hypothetical protein
VFEGQLWHKVFPQLRDVERDAALVRGIAPAVADRTREAEVRALLHERFVAAKPTGLKALLAAAPLEGVDLTRERDLGREVEL